MNMRKRISRIVITMKTMFSLPAWLILNIQGIPAIIDDDGELYVIIYEKRKRN